MAEGQSNEEIAARLFLTKGAVEQHVSKIFRKLDLGEDGNRRVQAVLRYLETA